MTALAWVLRSALIALGLIFLVSEMGQLAMIGAVIIAATVGALAAVYYTGRLLVGALRRSGWHR